MYIDGIRCRRSTAFGWRHGDPATDMDLDGEPVQPNYVTIVRIADCPIVEDERGRRVYRPTGVPQAFPIAHGGTYYGYGKCQVVKDGPGRWVRAKTTLGHFAYDKSGEPMYDLVYTYVKTPVYFVRDGYVYVGATYRHYDDKAKERIAKQRGKAA